MCDELNKNINTESLNKDKDFISLDENSKYETPEYKALNKLGLYKTCCRAIMISTIDLTEVISK